MTTGPDLSWPEPYRHAERCAATRASSRRCGPKDPPDRRPLWRMTTFTPVGAFLIASALRGITAVGQPHHRTELAILVPPLLDHGDARLRQRNCGLAGQLRNPSPHRPDRRRSRGRPSGL